MKYRPHDYAKAAYLSFRQKRLDHRRLARKLYQILLEHRQAKQLKLVMRLIDLFAQQDNQVLDIESPFKLDPPTIKYIERIYTTQTGQHLSTINQIVNRNLLGGIRGLSSTHRFDWTLNKRLNQLEAS